MPLQIIRQDITKLSCDAIVNAANVDLRGGGGVDGAIHKAAGPELMAECRTLGGCCTGEAKLTKGYALPCKYVIHTVGPIWEDGRHGEPQLLTACYRNSLELAKAHDCRSVAFPLIATGSYGYPKEEALRIATDTISAFLLEHDSDMLVYLVVFGEQAYRISGRLFSDVESFIDQHYVDAHLDRRRENRRSERIRRPDFKFSASGNFKAADFGVAAPCALNAADDAPGDLEAFIEQIDESFSQMLLRKIAEKGMTPPQCYNAANVDRKLFSKIRNNEKYHPGKATVLAFAVALKLTFPETEELLMKAGFALSHSSKFDLIVEYFIRKGEYNIFRINEVLFDNDQSLLGGV